MNANIFINNSLVVSLCHVGHQRVESYLSCSWLKQSKWGRTAAEKDRLCFVIVLPLSFHMTRPFIPSFSPQKKTKKKKVCQFSVPFVVCFLLCALSTFILIPAMHERSVVSCCFTVLLVLNQ